MATHATSTQMEAAAPNSARQNGAIIAARLAWLVGTLAALVLYGAAIPARYSELLTRCVGACAPGQIQTGASIALPLDLYAAWLLALDTAFAAVYVGLALLIFARKSADPNAIFVSLALTFWGVTFTGVMNALPARDPRWFYPVACASFLGAALITLFFYIFPDGRFIPRWARWLAAIFIVTQIPLYFWPDVAILNPTRWPAWLYVPVSGGFLGVMVGLQIYRYGWVSNAAQRRQAKWVVLGIGLALAGYTAMLVAKYFLAPTLGSSNYLIYVAGINACLMLIPISIAIAVLRDRLYDIDTLIQRSLVYGALTVSLATLYSVSVYAIGWIARLLTGLENSSLAIVLSTLGVAAAFQPLRRRIQRAIDRRFYRRRYNAMRALEIFGVAAQREVDLERLTAQLLEVVARTMEPAHVSLTLLQSSPQHQAKEPILPNPNQRPLAIRPNALPA